VRRKKLRPKRPEKRSGRDRTGGVIHLLVASLGVDGKQSIHQRYDAQRCNVLLVQFYRLDKPSSRVSPTCRMHDLRPADTVVGRVVIGLQKAFEVAQNEWLRPSTLTSA
jgi:hypothetical protein